MFIDCSKLPDPLAPLEDDVFTSLDGAHTLVVTRVPEHAIEDESRPPSAVITYSLNGIHAACPQGQLLGVIVSAGLRPWGRLDRSAATRPKITRDPELVAQRLQAIGPHLRALREQYGLSMGDLARALGCPGARLSMLELATPDPVREGAGVHQDEGVAALAELLAEAVALTWYRHCGGTGYSAPETHIACAGSPDQARERFKDAVWPEIAGMLATAPALAAIHTIHNATAEPAKGTGAWHQPSPKPGPDSVFQPGDRITYKGKAATVREVDHEHFAMLVTFESGETSAVPMTDAELANDNVAIRTARAGLAHLLTTELLKIPAHLSSVDPQEFQGFLEDELATGEAQRLIRLHG